MLQLTLSKVCPYCSAKNESQTISKNHSIRLSLPIFFGYKRSRSSTVQSFKINCIFCKRCFTLIKFEDLDWIKDSLIWDDSVRSSMVEIFGGSISRDSILTHITGFARQDNGTLDICFKKNKKRAYMSCVKENKRYKGTYMREISFD